MKKYNNAEAAELFKGKKVISNADGTIWTADDFVLYSSHTEEYKTIAKDWQVITCKFPGVRGFGKKKVRFTNLEKTEYVRENFSNTFTDAFFSSVCNLLTRNIEDYK